MMWQDFPGFAVFHPRNRGSFKDLWMAFNLQCGVALRGYHVTIWRDVVFRSGPLRAGDTTYRPIESERRRDFLEKIEATVVPSWNQKEYNNFRVLDGWMWTLTLRRGQKLKHWKGSNAYPGTFREVCNHISDLIEMPQLTKEAEEAYRPI